MTADVGGPPGGAGASSALLAKRPRLRGEVLLSRPMLRGPSEVYLVKNLRGGRAYEVSAREHFVMARLDGRRSLAEIGEEYTHAFGRRLGEAHWQQLLGLLYQRDLLDVDVPAAAGATVTAEVGEPGGPLRVLEAIHRRAGRLLARPVILTLLVPVVACQVLLLAHLDEAVAGLRWLWDHPLWLIPVALFTWISAALHEFAHGLAARRFGCAVTGISLVILRCRVDSYLYLRSPGAQITIAAAGGFTNGVLVVPFGLAWLLLPADAPARPAMAGVVLIGSAQALVNFIPLPPLDGYKILSHALGVADLATASRRFVLLAARAPFRGGGALADYPRRARVIYPAYGLLVVALASTVIIVAVLAGRALGGGRPGAAAVIIAITVAVMTLAGWLARPRRTPTAPGAPDARNHRKGSER